LQAQRSLPGGAPRSDQKRWKRTPFHISRNELVVAEACRERK
jgi:hypothetical protein